MPQIGWFELIIIVLVAVLVIGPKEFPIVMRKVGNFFGSIKRYFNDVQNSVNEITSLEEQEKKDDKKINDEKSGNFVSHLTELRSRIIRIFIFLFLSFLVCYYFSEEIYSFWLNPIVMRY